MDVKYYDRHDLFGKMVLKNFGTNGLFALSEAEPAYDTISEMMVYAVASVDEAKVLLTGPQRVLYAEELLRAAGARGTWVGLPIAAI